MEIKEMPLEEKYDRVFDDYLLCIAANYAFHKELGLVDKCLDYSWKIQKKMLPTLLGPAFKFLRAIAPGTAFKQVVNRYVYTEQAHQPLSDMELTWVSDREAVTRVKNCVALRKVRALVKKAGLDLDPRFICEIESKISIESAKEFGVDLTWKLEENGCTITAKLK